MDLGNLGVGESGRFAPTFTHPIHSLGLCHFDAAPAAGEIFQSTNQRKGIYSIMSFPHYAQKLWVNSRNDRIYPGVWGEGLQQPAPFFQGLRNITIPFLPK